MGGSHGSTKAAQLNVEADGHPRLRSGCPQLNVQPLGGRETFLMSAMERSEDVGGRRVATRGSPRASRAARSRTPDHVGEHRPLASPRGRPPKPRPSGSCWLQVALKGGFWHDLMRACEMLACPDRMPSLGSQYRAALQRVGT